MGIVKLGTECDVWIGKFGKDAKLTTAEERREGRWKWRLGRCFDTRNIGRKVEHVDFGIEG
jgi:hypothetical protein